MADDALIVEDVTGNDDVPLIEDVTAAGDPPPIVKAPTSVIKSFSKVGDVDAGTDSDEEKERERERAREVRPRVSLPHERGGERRHPRVLVVRSEADARGEEEVEPGVHVGV